MWSDRDTENDCLGFTSYVNVLCDICTRGELAPLTLGIFGSWGSGKTSLMRMLKRRVDGAEDGVKTLWFNAWRYEGREEAQSALIHAILNKVGEDKGLLGDARDVLARLTKGASILKLAKFISKTAITLTPDLNGFVDCFQEESKQIAETMEQFDRDFAEFLNRMNVEHIVVFIDDLDRCSSQKVIETFETIKLFLNTPSCTFIIGADAAKIEESVGEVYRVAERVRRKDFLEKIIQVPFSIPAQDLRDISCYVGMLVMQRHIEPDCMANLLEARQTFYQQGADIENAIRRWPGEHTVMFGNRLQAVRSDLDDVLPHVDVLARGLNGNPRQIKRFLNIVSLRRQLAKANDIAIESAILIKLAVLEYAWDDFFTAVVETLDPTTGKSVLIGEMLRVAAEEGTTDSQVVRESLERGGLVEFLTQEPQLTGELDLNPYLFLAQTSLSRGSLGSLQPLDDKTQSLVRLIESEDPLRTKTAAHQAAAQDAAVVAAVVRGLVNDLPQASSTVQTHMLNGLGIVCQAHKEHFSPVVRFLGQFSPPTSEAVLLAASTLIQSAEAAGVAVPEGLNEKYTSKSKVAAALALPKPRRKSSSKRAN